MEMSAERLKAVNEECARLNARAVVLRMEQMQTQLDAYKQEIAQTNQRIALLENRFNVELQLRAQLLNVGSGPTV